MGLRDGLDRCGKSHPQRDLIPDRPASSHSLYRLSYPAHTHTHTHTHTQTHIYMYIYKQKFCRLVYIYKLSSLELIKQIL